MRNSRNALTTIGGCLLLTAGLILIAACDRSPAPVSGQFTVFDPSHACTIGLSEDPSPEEQRAAGLLQHTLAKASGRPLADFPIRMGDDDMVGTIQLRGSNHRKSGQGRLDEKVTLKVSAERVEVTSYPADGIEAAVAWFLENKLGARWFMPGPLGEQIPLKKELRLLPGEETYAPSYISRNLRLGNSAGEQEWWNRNRLRAWFRHGHAMSGLFSPNDLKQNPDFAPLVNGKRYLPQATSEANWQPNIAAPGAAAHVAEVLSRRREFSSAIGMNDSIRYDQSEQTKAALGEQRWFRAKPNFSPLVFRFVNDVARRMPGRYLGAYAYDWAENTPGFSIERNVVPFLTADRSEWYDPAFAEEDKALIRHWLSAGSEVVGIYDYYYGAPFLVPRPALYAVSQSIPFAYEAGVRAFYAETSPNWGLDGPKAWLAAQLLWNATAKPDELLDIYYRDFWQEAAGPMREFFSICDQQWLNQPLPSYWIKFYKDEHQYLLYSSQVRTELRSLITRARALAKTDEVRGRIEFFSAAFAVTEAFGEFCEIRDELSRSALADQIDPRHLHRLVSQYAEARHRLEKGLIGVKHNYPLAINSSLLEEYTRNDPTLRAAWRLGSLPSTSGDELLADTALEQVEVEPPMGFFALEWVAHGPWRGHGEPYETRTVSLRRTVTGNQLIMQGCKQETFSQLVPAKLGRRYLARVRVRGRVSPGNMTFLILNFQNASGQTLGIGAIDRLPVGNYDQEVELVTWADAPPNATKVGLGVRALNQVGDDEAVFTAFSLQVMK